MIVLSHVAGSSTSASYNRARRHPHRRRWRCRRWGRDPGQDGAGGEGFDVGGWVGDDQQPASNTPRPPDEATESHTSEGFDFDSWLAAGDSEFVAPAPGTREETSPLKLAAFALFAASAVAVASTIASAAGMFGGGGGLGMIDLLGPLFRWVPMLGFGAAAIAVTVRRRGRA